MPLSRSYDVTPTATVREMAQLTERVMLLEVISSRMRQQFTDLEDAIQELKDTLPGAMYRSTE